MLGGPRGSWVVPSVDLGEVLVAMGLSLWSRSKHLLGFHILQRSLGSCGVLCGPLARSWKRLEVLGGPGRSLRQILGGVFGGHESVVLVALKTTDWFSHSSEVLGVFWSVSRSFGQFLEALGGPQGSWGVPR